MAHWHDMWNTFVIAINFCKAKKIICALMSIISNHYGTKSYKVILKLEPRIVLKSRDIGMICEMLLLL